MDLNALQAFVVKAKKSCYVGGGGGGRAPSSRLASHDLTYIEEEWAYRDSYFGGTDFIGQETVWLQNEPVWSMCYYGYVLRSDLITPTQAGQVLKEALSLPTSQGRLLDNLTFRDDRFDFKIESHGDIKHFKGRETITSDGILAYALDYFGGLIRP